MNHGRYTTYTNHACRCEACTAAWRDWYGARRRQDKPVPPTAHGSLSGYEYWKCRCDRCVDAKREALRRGVRRLKEKGVPDDAHGEPRGYLYYRCRCDRCRAAYSAFAAARWLRVKERRAVAENGAQPLRTEP